MTLSNTTQKERQHNTERQTEQKNNRQTETTEQKLYNIDRNKKPLRKVQLLRSKTQNLKGISFLYIGTIAHKSDKMKHRKPKNSKKKF